MKLSERPVLLVDPETLEKQVAKQLFQGDIYHNLTHQRKIFDLTEQHDPEFLFGARFTVELPA